VNSEEYEHLVAQLLTGEGWSAKLTPRHDKGLDVIAQRGEVRLGVQAKMWAAANRAINTKCVMITYAACAYFDCEQRMIATDARVLADAEEVAAKLDVEVRPVSAQWPRDMPAIVLPALSFGVIWSEHVTALTGQVLRRDNGTTNEIISVDPAGIVRRTSNGKTQRIGVDIFRWTIERLIAGETVQRAEINDHGGGRASSGVLLILSALPHFESTSLGGKRALRLAGRRTQR
jgi:restriction system protein